MIETIEYRTQDKSQWGDGPWQNEPDKKQWADKETGLPCLIVRNQVGALCGYVGIPVGHPLHGRSYKDDGIDNLEVHGGITFSDGCSFEDKPERSICHIDLKENKVWWLGFDCAHFDDFIPKLFSDLSLYSVPLKFGTYKDIDYVTKEVESLARQLKSLML